MAIVEGIKLTDRDIEIIKFVNNFGFCEMPQVQKRFELEKRWAYLIMGRLIKADLIKHERIFYGKHGIYRATSKGARFTELPQLQRVPLATYHHDLRVIELFLKLQKEYSEANWISERKLRHEKYFDGVGKRGHLPDAMLVFPDGKQVALEVELTNKSKQRVEQIIKGYSKQFEIKEVWYYCLGRALTEVQEAAKGKSYIKVFNLGEVFK